MFVYYGYNARPMESVDLISVALVSFTSQRGIADEFGDTIIEAEVPVAKILFFNDLLLGHPLRCEAECLVIGGDYRVKMSYW